MTPRMLRITGPARTPYQFGEPLHVYEEATHIGTVEGVRVTRDGATLHLENFVVAEVVERERRRVRKLVLFELAAFVADQYPGVLAISFSLNMRIPGQDDGMKLAATRAALLRGMGAEQIKIVPDHEVAHAGHFVVDGVWTRSDENLEALRASLLREREVYAALGSRGPLSRLSDRFRHWVRGIDG